MLSPAQLNIWSLKISSRRYRRLRIPLEDNPKFCWWPAKLDLKEILFVELKTDLDSVKVDIGFQRAGVTNIPLVIVERLYHNDSRMWLDCSSVVNYYSTEPDSHLRLLSECAILGAKISKTLNKLELYHP